MKNQHIKELILKNQAFLLLQRHSVTGEFRHENDLIAAQDHATKTIKWCHSLINDIEGSIEEKLDFLKSVFEEIPKFHAGKYID